MGRRTAGRLSLPPPTSLQPLSPTIALASPSAAGSWTYQGEVRGRVGSDGDGESHVLGQVLEVSSPGCGVSTSRVGQGFKSGAKFSLGEAQVT